MTRVEEYLKRPYGWLLVPEPDGSFHARIIEFPGCIAVGDTAAEALANLEDVAESWLEATLAKGQKVPEPVEHALPFARRHTGVTDSCGCVFCDLDVPHARSDCSREIAPHPLPQPLSGRKG